MNTIRKLKLQHKFAAFISIFGVALLFSVMAVNYMNSRLEVVEHEKVELLDISKERAEHINIAFGEMERLASSMIQAPVVVDALRRSNSAFEALTHDERKGKIDRLNKKWMNSTDPDGPFVSAYMTNPAAAYLKKGEASNPGLFGEIFLTDRFGALVAATNKLTTLAHAHKKWWIAAYDEGRGKVFFDDRGFDVSAEGYVLGVVVPIREKSEIIGILKCNFNILKILSTTVEHRYLIEKGGEVKIVRSGGRIVLEKGSPPLSGVVPDVMAELLGKRRLDIMELELKGRKVIVVVNPVAITMGSSKYGFGGTFDTIDHVTGNRGEYWAIVMIQGLEELLEPMNQRMKDALFTGTIMILIIVFIAYILGKKMAAPLVAMSKMASRVGGGAFGIQLDTSSGDEMGDLAKAFNKMSEDLKVTTVSIDELTKSRDMAQSYLDIAGTMILAINEKGEILLVNRRGCEILGCKVEDVLGSNWFDNFLPERLRDEVKTVFERVIADEIESVENYENPVLTSGGEERLIAWHNSYLKDDSGKIVGCLSSGRDITERRQAEAAFQTLIEVMVGNMGQEFFDKIVNSLCEWLDVDCAIIGELVDEGNVKALSMVIDGKAVQYSYALHGTPCERVEEKGFCVFPEGICKLFPDDRDLVDMGAEGYAGAPVRDKSGNVIGILCVISRRKLTVSEREKSVIEIIAAKAAVEIERKRMMAKLQESEERFRNIYEESPIGIELYDLEGKLLQTNKACLNIFGVTDVEEVKGFGLFEDPNVTDDIKDRLHKGEAVRYEALFDFDKVKELELYRTAKSGGICLDVLITPLGRKGSSIGYLVQVQDVTDRKRMEEDLRASLTEKELLLKEVHHRVKNNLQIISSLIALQSGYVEVRKPAEILNDSQNRIRSMALIHEMLYKSEDLVRIDFHDYVENLVSHFIFTNPVNRDEIDIVINIDKIQLDIDKAIPCGLIINELVSNSIEHAFHEREEGKISIELHRDNDKDCCLVVKDNGVGLPADFDIERSDSLGLQIVNNLAGQIEGSVRIEGKGGTTISVLFEYGEEEIR